VKRHDELLFKLPQVSRLSTTIYSFRFYRYRRLVEPHTNFDCDCITVPCFVPTIKQKKNYPYISYKEIRRALLNWLHCVAEATPYLHGTLGEDLLPRQQNHFGWPVTWSKIIPGPQHCLSWVLLLHSQNG